MMNDAEINELEIVVHRCFEGVADALGHMLGGNGHLQLYKVGWEPLETYVDMAGVGDAPCLIAACELEGSLSGWTSLLVPLDQMPAMMERLGIPEGQDEMAQSAVQELANILMCAFLNGLAAHLDLACRPSSPTILEDLGSAVLTSLVMSDEDVGDEILALHTGIEGPGGLCPVLVFLPDQESQQRIHESLGNAGE